MKTHSVDYTLLAIIVLFVVLGLLMVASASIGVSQENFGENYHYLKNQILKGLLPGIVLGYIAFIIPCRFWRKSAFLIFAASVILLIMVFLPSIGVAHGGSQRWLELGPVTFQPSEIIKLSLIIYLAAWLEAKGKEGIKKFSEGVIPFAVMLGLVGLLLFLEPDYGTLGTIGLTSLIIFFLGGGRISHLAMFIGGACLLFLTIINVSPHAAERWQTFLHPEESTQSISYQINQSWIALGSGGFFGQGLGQSIQKFRYLPQPATDSIAAVIGEEFGFFGLLCLIMLFVIFASQGIKVARGAPDNFSRLLAAGIIVWIVTQAFINLAAISGLMPLTGITLPFFSLGGSSLVITLIAMGILLNISKYSKI